MIGSEKFYFSDLITTSFYNHSERLNQLKVLLQWSPTLAIGVGVLMLPLMLASMSDKIKQISEDSLQSILLKANAKFLLLGDWFYNPEYFEEYKHVELSFSLADKKFKKSWVSESDKQHFGKIDGSSSIFKMVLCHRIKKLQFASSLPEEIKKKYKEIVDGSMGIALFINGHLLPIDRLQKVKFPYPSTLAAIKDPTKQQQQIAEFNEAYTNNVAKFVQEYYLAINSQKDKLNEHNLSDSTLVYPAESGLIPLHFPNKYLENLQKHSKINGIFVAENFGFAPIFLKYKFKETLNADAEPCYSLLLTYCTRDQHLKEYELITILVATFDSASVNAYKKLQKTAIGKYEYIQNKSEFLLFAMYGTPAWLGFPAQGTTDLDGHGTICPVENQFIGLYSILKQLDAEHIFNYQCDQYTDEVRVTLMEFKADKQLPSNLESFIVTDKTKIRYQIDYFDLLKAINKINENFYISELKNDDSLFKEKVRALYEKYQLMLAICKLIADVDYQTIAQKLQDNVNIVHPYYLEQLAETNFSMFLECMKEKSAFSPTGKDVQEVTHFLEKLRSSTIQKLESIIGALREWQHLPHSKKDLSQLPQVDKTLWEQQEDPSCEQFITRIKNDINQLKNKMRMESNPLEITNLNTTSTSYSPFWHNHLNKKGMASEPQSEDSKVSSKKKVSFKN